MNVHVCVYILLEINYNSNKMTAFINYYVNIYKYKIEIYDIIR